MQALLMFPLVGAAIGWFTNYLAVKMIFRPRKPILGIQGLIPRRRQDLAHSIGETVSSHLIHKEDIIKALPLDKLQKEFENLVGSKVDSFINNKFIGDNPMLAAFISDDLKAKIRQGVVDEMSDLLPGVEEKILEGLENNFDMRSVVIEKIENFDVEKLESIVLSIARRELKAIEIFGGVLGAIVGLIQYFLVTQNLVVFS